MIEYSENKKYAYYIGYKFTRDEKTNYFRNGKLKQRLHRFIYENENNIKLSKEISVHHIDGNKFNNEINNLEILTNSEHAKLHGIENKNNPEILQRMRDNLTNNARPKASEWHGSKEGIEWHRIHAINVANNMKVREYNCLQCEVLFYKKPFGENKFCSNACKSKYRRKLGLDNIEKQCLTCNNVFMSNKYAKQQLCSHKCSGKFRSNKVN